MAGKTTEPQNKNKNVYCSFCGNPADKDREIVAGPNGVFICKYCVEVAGAVIEESKQDESLAALSRL